MLATMHMVICKTPSPNPGAGWGVLKATLILPGIEVSYTNKRNRKEKS
jgi:hypothetical protein